METTAITWKNKVGHKWLKPAAFLQFAMDACAEVAASCDNDVLKDTKTKALDAIMQYKKLAQKNVTRKEHMLEVIKIIRGL